jgi:four helix bundle protein
MDKPHKRLLAWQKSMDLVVEIYELTKSFPKDEIYGLTSQLRRASVSVPSNLSEGAAGRSVIQFRSFLSVAIGSLNEVSTQLEIAYRVGYLDAHKRNSAERRVDECLALTFGLRKSLLKRLATRVLLVLTPLLLTAYCLPLTNL